MHSLIHFCHLQVIALKRFHQKYSVIDKNKTAIKKKKKKTAELNKVYWSWIL